MATHKFYLSASGTNGNGSRSQPMRSSSVMTGEILPLDPRVIGVITAGSTSLTSYSGTALEKELRSINERLSRIEQMLLDRPLAPEGERPVRDIPDNEAKDEVKKYFEAHHGEDIYPDEIADRLGLELMQVVRVCEELTKEGRLGAGHT